MALLLDGLSAVIPHRRTTEAGKAVTDSGPHHAIDRDPLSPRASWCCLPQEPSGTKLSNLGLARMGSRISLICLALDNARINSCSAFELKHRCASTSSSLFMNLFLFSCFEYKQKPPERKDKDCPQKKKAIYDPCGTLTDLWKTNSSMSSSSIDETWFPKLCVAGLLGHALTTAFSIACIYIHFAFWCKTQAVTWGGRRQGGHLVSAQLGQFCGQHRVPGWVSGWVPRLKQTWLNLANG